MLKQLVKAEISVFWKVLCVPRFYIRNEYFPTRIEIDVYIPSGVGKASLHPGERGAP
jgi:hypothetical protein